ncbi:Hypothetical predicted protein [Paramuricea clavata]|uniref:Uncharacterized protein n=1 Tax=Paramuricea clavata TaxID=317549 RepID=A0A7D9IBU5_PARCT|nr:Hypothetical predicted protein [Paramuricea clavata]
MQQTISQLSQTNKHFEEEQSSLVTAIKIIQNDFNQQAISRKKSGEAREETGGGIDDNMWKKSKSKHQSKRPTSLLSNSGENSKRKTGDIKLKNQYETLTTKILNLQVHHLISNLTRNETISSKVQQKEPMFEDKKRN